MRTIGFRLGLLVFGCLFIAFAAGAGVIYTLHVTDRTVDRALAAQRRAVQHSQRRRAGDAREVAECGVGASGQRDCGRDRHPLRPAGGTGA